MGQVIMLEQRQRTQKTFSGQMRAIFAGWTGRIGRMLYGVGVHPDAVSILGLLVVGVGAILAGRGQFVAAGWVIFVGSILDVLDGAVARAWEQANPFGGVLDSTLDRYADGFIFVSLSYYFASQNQTTFMLLPLAALVGSYSVSYVRARADAADVGVRVTVGLFSRLERLIVVVWALWFHGWLLVPGLWLLAIGTNITAIQRLWFVRKQIRK